MDELDIGMDYLDSVFFDSMSKSAFTDNSLSSTANAGSSKEKRNVGRYSSSNQIKTALHHVEGAAIIVAGDTAELASAPLAGSLPEELRRALDILTAYEVPFTLSHLTGGENAPRLVSLATSLLKSCANFKPDLLKFSTLVFGDFPSKPTPGVTAPMLKRKENALVLLTNYQQYHHALRIGDSVAKLLEVKIETAIADAESRFAEEFCSDANILAIYHEHYTKKKSRSDKSSEKPKSASKVVRVATKDVCKISYSAAVTQEKSERNNNKAAQDALRKFANYRKNMHTWMCKFVELVHLVHQVGRNKLTVMQAAAWLLKYHNDEKNAVDNIFGGSAGMACYLVGHLYDWVVGLNILETTTSAVTTQQAATGSSDSVGFVDEARDDDVWCRAWQGNSSHPAGYANSSDAMDMYDANGIGRQDFDHWHADLSLLSASYPNKAHDSIRLEPSLSTSSLLLPAGNDDSSLSCLDEYMLGDDDLTDALFIMEKSRPNASHLATSLPLTAHHSMHDAGVIGTMDSPLIDGISLLGAYLGVGSRTRLSRHLDTAHPKPSTTVSSRYLTYPPRSTQPLKTATNAHAVANVQQPPAIMESDGSLASDPLARHQQARSVEDGSQQAEAGRVIVVQQARFLQELPEGYLGTAPFSEDCSKVLNMNMINHIHRVARSEESDVSLRHIWFKPYAHCVEGNGSCFFYATLASIFHHEGKLPEGFSTATCLRNACVDKVDEHVRAGCWDDDPLLIALFTYLLELYNSMRGRTEPLLTLTVAQKMEAFAKYARLMRGVKEYADNVIFFAASLVLKRPIYVYTWAKEEYVQCIASTGHVSEAVRTEVLTKTLDRNCYFECKVCDSSALDPLLEPIYLLLIRQHHEVTRKDISHFYALQCDNMAQSMDAL